MRRFLSWIVLCVITLVIDIFSALVMMFGGYILDLIGKLNAFFQIIIFLTAGGTILSFLLLPAIRGPALTVWASESISQTKNGARYVVFAVFMLICSILRIYFDILHHDFSLNLLVMCLYYILLIVCGRAAASENN